MRVVAPVTTLGDAVGLLELFLPAAPNAQVMREIGETAHALAYIVIANRSFTDAMGHDVDAALLAALVAAALRRARQAGTGLDEQARQADQAMRDHGRQGHVTRQLLRINLLDGTTEFVEPSTPGPCGHATDRSGRPLRKSIYRSPRPPGRARRHLSGAVAGSAARRPAGDAHRRHAGAQRPEPRPARPDRPNPRPASPRGLPHTRSERSSTPAKAIWKTARPSCAWPGRRRPLPTQRRRRRRPHRRLTPSRTGQPAPGR